MASRFPSLYSLFCVILISPIIPNCARHIEPKTISDDRKSTIFFRLEDLKVGNKFIIYYPLITAEGKIKLLPREKADTIPFSSKYLPLLLKAFNFAEESPQAKGMAYTIRSCESTHKHADMAFCAASLESMLDQARRVFGQDTKINILTTTLSPDHKMDIQNYTIVEEPEPIETEIVLGCHSMPFPFKVYFCHAQLKDHKVYKIKLVGDDGEKIESPGLCHTDTSQWNPTHVAFKVLKTEPGKSTICHFTPADNLLWVMSPNHIVM